METFDAKRRAVNERIAFFEDAIRPVKALLLITALCLASLAGCAANTQRPDAQAVAAECVTDVLQSTKVVLQYPHSGHERTVRKYVTLSPDAARGLARIFQSPAEPRGPHSIGGHPQFMIFMTDRRSYYMLGTMISFEDSPRHEIIWSGDRDPCLANLATIESRSHLSDPVKKMLRTLESYGRGEPMPLMTSADGDAVAIDQRMK